MMTCGGSSFRSGNNYNNGSYLGEPPILIYQDPDAPMDYNLRIKFNNFGGIDSSWNTVNVAAQVAVIPSAEQKRRKYYIAGKRSLNSWDYGYYYHYANPFSHRRISPEKFRLIGNTEITPSLGTTYSNINTRNYLVPYNFLSSNWWPKEVYCINNGVWSYPLYSYVRVTYVLCGQDQALNHAPGNASIRYSNRLRVSSNKLRYTYDLT